MTNENRIKTNGFSSAASERLYREGWPEEPACKAKYEDGAQCGGCSKSIHSWNKPISKRAWRMHIDLYRATSFKSGLRERRRHEVFVRKLAHGPIVRLVELTVDEQVEGMAELLEHRSAELTGAVIVTVTRGRIRVRRHGQLSE